MLNASNQVHTVPAESVSTLNNGVPKELADEVAEFDRKVESLDKFKLELYQQLQSLDKQAPISESEGKTEGSELIKSDPLNNITDGVGS